MKLALRRDAASDATALQAFACKVIKARLVSQFCHGAIVVGDNLYHATGTHGLHMLTKDQWNPEKWFLIDLGEKQDARVINLFEQIKGMPYDWFSLLAFAGLNAKDGNKLYCFEWCWWCIHGAPPDTRVTPEMLILEATDV
jgi:hypothetical protein